MFSDYAAERIVSHHYHQLILSAWQAITFAGTEGGLRCLAYCKAYATYSDESAIIYRSGRWRCISRTPSSTPSLILLRLSASSISCHWLFPRIPNSGITSLSTISIKDFSLRQLNKIPSMLE